MRMSAMPYWPARAARRGRALAAAWLLGLSALACLSAGLTAPARANSFDRGVDIVTRTALPYWQVGDVDKGLSRLCSMGQFNQRVPFRLAGHFYGPRGAAMVGAAKGSGLNLWDPFKRGDNGHDYWFYRDRTAACIVFSAKVKDATPASGAANTGALPQSASAQQAAAPAVP